MFSVGRMQIRNFRRFRQNGPFWQGTTTQFTKNMASATLSVGLSISTKQATEPYSDNLLNCTRILGTLRTVLLARVPLQNLVMNRKRAEYCFESTVSEKRIAKASAPYRGRNRQNREKRVSGSKKLPFSQCPRNGRFESKNPHFSTGLHEKNGDFLTQSAHFWDTGKWEFLTPKPSFPGFGDFDPCRGRTLSQEEKSLSLGANSVSSAKKNSVSSLLHTNNRLRGAH